jgi:hypothetical protein
MLKIPYVLLARPCLPRLPSYCYIGLGSYFNISGVVIIPLVALLTLLPDMHHKELL